MSDNENDQDEWISRADKKRNLVEVKTLAESLIELSDKQLTKLEISTDLKETIKSTIDLKDTKESFRRQMKFLVKFLRQSDIDKVQAELKKNTSRQAGIEVNSIITDMLEGGDEFINSFIESYPGIERQKIRQLIRQIKKETKLENEPKSYMKLKSYIVNYL